MSVRVAELLMAVAFALLSIVFMWKSTDGLSIWWVPEKGPGSGMWPFWLSVLMLLTCLTIIFRWLRRATPQSRSDEPFMDRHAAQLLGITVAALAFLILGSGYVGIYISLFAFLFFYFKILGGHTWSLSVALTVAIPIGVFLLFEYLLTIPLPKGISEPLFLPLYKIMYGKGLGVWVYVIAMLLAGLTILAPQYLRKLLKREAPPESTARDNDLVYVFGTLAAFILLVFGVKWVGFYLAVLLFEFVYLKLLARQPWIVSVVAAAGVPLAIYLLLHLALGLQFPITGSLFA